MGGGVEVLAVGGGEEDGHVFAVGGEGDEAEVVGVEGGRWWQSGRCRTGCRRGRGSGGGEGVEAVGGWRRRCAVDATKRLGDEGDGVVTFGAMPSA